MEKLKSLSAYAQSTLAHFPAREGGAVSGGGKPTRQPTRVQSLPPAQLFRGSWGSREHLYSEANGGTRCKEHRCQTQMSHWVRDS